MKCKIFVEATGDTLEEKVNQWLEEHPCAISEKQLFAAGAGGDAFTGIKFRIIIVLWYIPDNTNN